MGLCFLLGLGLVGLGSTIGLLLTESCMCLLLVAVGWICLLSMAHIRLPGIGLSVGSVKGVWANVFKALIKGYSIGKISLDRVAVDSTT
ncbi:MAG: hypothetical protein QXL74_02970, partial [Candidatus Bathyarchaeia archaeon]